MAGTVIKGVVEVEVDEAQLEAQLKFVPSKEGEDWNAERVLKSIAEKRISPAPAGKALEEILQKFAKSKTETSAVIGKGTAPEHPVPEKILWSDVFMPPELAEVAKQAVDRAKPPELYRVRVEKIKVETVVKKPGALPFLPPKEETVVTYDKKETKETASVDPTLSSTVYVEKGQKLGIVQPPKPGKPGKSVYGKPLPPPNPPEGGFLTGAGIERDKTDLRALYSGVVRIADTWADIVPLAKPKWKVDKGSDGATIYFWFEPGAKSLDPPTAAEALAAAVAKGGVEDEMLAAGEIDDAIAKATRSGEALEAFSLSKRVDGEARIELSPDNILATLHLRKGRGGGRTLELKDVSEAIRRSRVKGFNAEKVKTDILAFFKGEEQELSPYPLFEGKAPTRGKDREIQSAVAFLKEELRQELTERAAVSPNAGFPSDPANYFPPREATQVAFVEKDAVVGTTTQTTPGADGLDALGEVLPGLPGNDPDLHILHGLRMRGNEIRSDFSGIMLVKKEGDSFWAYVLPYKDARAEADIADDRMSATLSLEREFGAGRPLNSETAAKALAEAGVVKGIDAGAVSDVLSKAMEQGRAGPETVARGAPAVPGGATSVRWLVHLPEDKLAAQRAAAWSGEAKPRILMPVAEGSPVAEIVTLGEEGQPGWDVAGKTIEAAKGMESSVVHDDSLKEQPIKGGVRLVAARTGQLDFDGLNLRINAFRHVEGDVGPKTGNVNFPGEVRVSGGVKPGFAAVGTGDVLITGIAEAALVSAGGKVIVSQGVRGGGKGAVRARLTIETAMAEQATLLAVQDIVVSNGCLQCQVKTNGRLSMPGERGHLAGGVCKARHGVNACNVGVESGARTEISFGQDYLIKDQIESMEREAEKVKHALVELDKKLKQIVAAKAKPDAARAEKVRLMKYMENVGMKLFTLREKFEEHHPSEIRVRGTAFPGVVLESHGRYFEVKQRRNGVIFFFDRESGRIQEKPIK